MRQAVGCLTGLLLPGFLCMGLFYVVMRAHYEAAEGSLPPPARPAYRAWLEGRFHPDLIVEDAAAWEGEAEYIGGRCVPERLPVPGGSPITLDFGAVYGEGAPAEMRGRRHAGIDFSVPVGTPIQATLDGVVVFADYDAGWPSYGNLVVICNGPVCALYGHLSEIRVAVGQRVEAGALIGLSGNTGTSTGPHLHYEVRVGGRAVDPRTLDPAAQACAEAARKAAAGGGEGGGGGLLIRRAALPDPGRSALVAAGVGPVRVSLPGREGPAWTLAPGEALDLSGAAPVALIVAGGGETREISVERGEAVWVVSMRTEKPAP